ncbi:hypothetical protein GCM10029992_39910 [Glycomyces albus]
MTETFTIVEVAGGSYALRQVHKPEGSETGRWLGMDAGRLVLVEDVAGTTEFDLDFVFRGTSGPPRWPAGRTWPWWSWGTTRWSTAARPRTARTCGCRTPSASS